MVIIALGNGHYDLKILRSLFRAKKTHFRATVGSLAPRCPPLADGRRKKSKIGEDGSYHTAQVGLGDRGRKNSKKRNGFDLDLI